MALGLVLWLWLWWRGEGLGGSLFGVVVVVEEGGFLYFCFWESEMEWFTWFLTFFTFCVE